jgi:hypothetical protein
MRLIKATRGGSSESDPTIVGPVCDAYPFIVRDINVDYYGDPSTELNQVVDILDGNDKGDWGWLSWNPDNATGSESARYLRDELRTSRTPLNDYTNAKDDSDHKLSTGDWVASLNGTTTSVERATGLLTALVGKKIRIPVWDTFEKGTGKGSTDAYHIVGFAWVKIVEIENGKLLSPSDKSIDAIYLGPATDDCTAP